MIVPLPAWFEWFPVLEGIKTRFYRYLSDLVSFEWFPVLEGIKTQ